MSKRNLTSVNSKVPFGSLSRDEQHSMIIDNLPGVWTVTTERDGDEESITATFGPIPGSVKSVGMDLAVYIDRGEFAFDPYMYLTGWILMDGHREQVFRLDAQVGTVGKFVRNCQKVRAFFKLIDEPRPKNPGKCGDCAEWLSNDDKTGICYAARQETAFDFGCSDDFTQR